MTREEEVVSAFVAAPQSRRLLELLGMKNRGRARASEYLNHAIELDPRFVKVIPAAEHDASSIHARLRKLGAPEVCYVWSANHEIDGREMPLLQALEVTIGDCAGTFLICTPRLAYFEYEDPGERYILSGPDTPAELRYNRPRHGGESFRATRR